MIRAALIAIAACIPTAANAANWIYIGRASSASVWYADSETVTRSGSFIYVWVKIDESENKKVKHHESKVRIKINCAAQTTRWISWVDYDRVGDVVSSETQYDYSTDMDMEPAIPETVVFKLVQDVCG